MIPRNRLLAAVSLGLRQFPVVAILGPRQCGKTTLAQTLAGEREATYFDLEDPTDQARLAQPKLALEPRRGLVILDEIPPPGPRRPQTRSRLGRTPGDPLLPDPRPG